MGSDPCSWLRICERYFQYNHVLDPQQKLKAAVLHLVGKAEAWFFSYQVSRGTISWKDFCEKICRKLLEVDNRKFNLIGELNKLE